MPNYAIILNNQCPRTVTSSRERGPYKEGQWKVYTQKPALSAVRFFQQRLNFSSSSGAENMGLLLNVNFVNLLITQLYTKVILEFVNATLLGIVAFPCLRKVECLKLQKKLLQKEKHGELRITFARKSLRPSEDLIALLNSLLIELRMLKRSKKLDNFGPTRILNVDERRSEIVALENLQRLAITPLLMWLFSSRVRKANAIGAEKNLLLITSITAFRYLKAAVMVLTTSYVLAQIAILESIPRCHGNLPDAFCDAVLAVSDEAQEVLGMQIVKQMFDTLEIRAIEQGGEFWFVAADVAKALDIANTTDALKRLDQDEVTLVSNEGQSGVGTNYISESGLYSLILGSRKPQAKPFKRWVTHDLLPTLRRTGFYSMREPVVTIQAIARAYGLTSKNIPYYLEQHGLLAVGQAEHPDTGKLMPLFLHEAVRARFMGGLGPARGPLRAYSGPWDVAAPALPYAAEATRPGQEN